MECQKQSGRNRFGYEHTHKDYGLFCTGIEKIAKQLGVPPEYAEEMVFSNGGWGLGNWRKHVIAERLKTYKSSHSSNLRI